MIRRPKFKVSRRLGDRIHPKTQTAKYSVSAAKKGPAHNVKKPSQRTEFGTQFVEKQKVRLTYGVTEKQFRKYVEKAREETKANPAQNLHELLESRLDNVVYRAGITPSRPAARQLVSHGHVFVNGSRQSIPSYPVKRGDVVTIREASAKSKLFTDLDVKLKKHKFPTWLLFNEDKVATEVSAMPVFAKGEAGLNLGSVIEFYSRV
ncbi:MAG: 30S ribosomal protein S4 [Candidatus Paceibacterota bacterium]|jgi:small subunit ribosomal protein S4